MKLKTVDPDGTVAMDDDGNVDVQMFYSDLDTIVVVVWLEEFVYLLCFF